MAVHPSSPCGVLARKPRKLITSLLSETRPGSGTRDVVGAKPRLLTAGIKASCTEGNLGLPKCVRRSRYSNPVPLQPGDDHIMRHAKRVGMSSRASLPAAIVALGNALDAHPRTKRPRQPAQFGIVTRMTFDLAQPCVADRNASACGRWANYADARHFSFSDTAKLLTTKGNGRLQRQNAGLESTLRYAGMTSPASLRCAPR